MLVSSVVGVYFSNALYIWKFDFLVKFVYLQCSWKSI